MNDLNLRYRRQGLKRMQASFWALGAVLLAVAGCARQEDTSSPAATVTQVAFELHGVDKATCDGGTLKVVANYSLIEGEGELVLLVDGQERQRAKPERTPPGPSGGSRRHTLECPGLLTGEHEWEVRMEGTVGTFKPKPRRGTIVCP